jgi:hypothetical protein
MISWKRSLIWTLCWTVASAAASAEEVAAPAAADPAAASPASAAVPAATPAEAAPVPPETATGAPASEVVPAAAAPEAAPAEATAAMPATTEAAAPAAGPTLGPVGFDSQGHQGRIHTVVRGDTLWAISNAYLATPWTWPSIWKDNGEIKNPHRIYPGEKIWITPSEMRRLSPEEADQMVSNVPAAPAPAPAPAAVEDAVPGMTPAPATPARTVRVSTRESAGLISPQQYKASASVVSRVPERLLLTQEDRVYIGLGEGEVNVGDEFTLIRTNEKVLDPDTGALLGYHVDFLGWVKVEETSPETSLARIHMSTGEIEEGDRVLPREPLPQQVDVKPAPSGIDGKITFFPGRRVLMGYQDFVYLNRGTLDGLEVGSPLEVYRAGFPAREVTRDERVAVPDRVIAKMLVVRAGEQTAVAMVTSTETELVLGDHFRGETPPQTQAQAHSQ